MSDRKPDIFLAAFLDRFADTLVREAYFAEDSIPTLVLRQAAQRLRDYAEPRGRIEDIPADIHAHADDAGLSECDCGRIEHGRHHMSCPAVSRKMEANVDEQSVC